MNKAFVALILTTFLLGCKGDGKLFKNPSASKTGISFNNTLNESDDLNILDYLYFYNGGGVATGDINNDGLVDIFFSGNQIKNKLYLNQGDLKFEDISDNAGVSGNSSWNTGAVMVDINADGFLDIYVCAVVGVNGFRGHNELYINNQDNTFTERAAEYGLDFDTYSSNAAFFDYDLDGDLDMYLLNHAVHTSETYGKAELRNERVYETGDKLLRNDDGKFIDVSEEAGIYGGLNGYGLGVAISDFNQDGYPDIYVGNDFHEDDYYYLNNGPSTDPSGSVKVTFTESLREYFGHTSRFSMGSDVADINRDGLPDLVSLDMLPEDEKVLKSSEGDDNVQTQKLRIEQFGYHYQFTRNMLYVNQSDGNYLEIAMMSGIAATDWSWSALFADFDQDGFQDLFVSNGIPKRPNDLDFIKFLSSDQIRNKINNTKLVDQKALDLMPSGNTHNYIFHGKENLSFEDKSKDWMVLDTLTSGATAMADFDNDGDIDLVTNNLNNSASLYINTTDGKSNFLKINLDQSGNNKFGVGAKVISYHKGIKQYKELYPYRGFQSSSEPMVHFGYGKVQKVDSIQIIWPDKTSQVLKDIAVNQNLRVVKRDTKPFDFQVLRKKTNKLFTKVEDNLGLNFQHKEDGYNDFNREKLIPYKISDRGPAIAIGDLNEDGKNDILFGGSKFMPTKTFILQDSTFAEIEYKALSQDSIQETVSAVIADFNGDTKNDVFLASGGGDFFGKSEPLQDVLYIKDDSSFVFSAKFDIYQNTSVIAPCDFDSDGDLDVFVGGHTITSNFGGVVKSTVLINENGSFSEIDHKTFSLEGMVTNAIWNDFDNDGSKDLIVVGEWMSPRFFKNTDGKLTEVNTIKLNGLWQTIEPFDIDGDGDTDYLLGNWGLNSKFTATDKKPLKMFYADFDNNGQTETVTAIEKNGNYYALEGLDGLASQMVFLRKKFNSYKSFAGKPIDKIFDEESLSKAVVSEVHTLKSGYLKNENGSFTFVPFQAELQISPILDFLTFDFDGDGKREALAAGNYFGVKPYQGRFDSFPGALIKNENNVILGSEIGLDFSQKSSRNLSIITINNVNYLLATFNNDKAEVYQINSEQ